MKIAVGSDERTYLTDYVVEELKNHGHEVKLYGPINEENIQWTDVAHKVAESIKDGSSDQGILFCWTGTGVSIAANKVPGIRAALCTDAQTAEGARKWNDANILAISLRSTSQIVAKEILEAWFKSSPEEEEKENIDKIEHIERKYSR